MGFVKTSEAKLELIGSDPTEWEKKSELEDADKEEDSVEESEDENKGE